MEDQISSPTFTIVNEYIKNGKKIYHFDVYRLSDIEEFYDMGGDEYYDRATCIIEWADIIEDALPDRYLKIIIEKEEDINIGLNRMWEDTNAPFLLNVNINVHTNVYPKMLFGNPLTKMEPTIE
mgnify:FL=1